MERTFGVVSYRHLEDLRLRLPPKASQRDNTVDGRRPSTRVRAVSPSPQPMSMPVATDSDGSSRASSARKTSRFAFLLSPSGTVGLCPLWSFPQVPSTGSSDFSGVRSMHVRRPSFQAVNHPRSVRRRS